MADLGVIGTKGHKSANAWNVGQYIPQFWRGKITIGDTVYREQAKYTDDGSPLQPSLRMTKAGMFAFRWPVSAGTRTLQVSVKNALGVTPYPTLTIKANTEIGVNTDVVGTAIAGTGWQTIGPLTVSPSADGVLLVLFESRVDRQDSDVRWDYLVDDLGDVDTFGRWYQGSPVFSFAASSSGTEDGSVMSEYHVYGTMRMPNTFGLLSDDVDNVVPVAKLVRADGANVIRGTHGPRRIVYRGALVRGPIKTSGLTSLRASFDALTAQFFSNDPLNLYTGESDRYLRNVECTHCNRSYEPNGYSRQWNVDVEFLTGDPFYYSTTTTSDAWTVSTSGATHTITTTGNAYAQPVFSITVGGSGAKTIAYTLTNNTSGNAFTLAGNVTGGDVIVVDTLNRTVTIAGVDKISLFDGLWIELLSGANVLTETYGVATITSIATSYINRYW